MKPTRAWHFTGDTLRDGSPIPAPGVKLVYTGRIELCESGYHASLHPFDALQYAPGPRLHLVELSGRILLGDDKLVAKERTIIASMDANEMLRYFARMCALRCVDKWDAPDVVLDWLMTGDEALRSAYAAAYSAYPAAYSARSTYAARNSAAYAAMNSAERSEIKAEFAALVHECFQDFL